MQDTESKKLRKIDVGVIVTIALAIIGFAFWLGNLNSRVSQMQPEKITDKKNQIAQEVKMTAGKRV